MRSIYRVAFTLRSSLIPNEPSKTNNRCKNDSLNIGQLLQLLHCNRPPSVTRIMTDLKPDGKSEFSPEDSRLSGIFLQVIACDINYLDCKAKTT